MILRAYFDESGKKDKTAMSIAGGIAPLENWISLELEWQQLLHDERLEQFHMTDFESNWGEFKGWGKERHELVLNRILCIMNKYILCYIGACDAEIQYNSSLQERSIDPYWGCLNNCASAADFEVQERFEENDTVQLVFAEHETTGKIATWYQHFKKEFGEDYPCVQGISFDSPSRIPSLQAADVIAYELYKLKTAQIENSNRPTRYPMKHILNHKYRFFGL